MPNATHATQLARDRREVSESSCTPSSTRNSRPLHPHPLSLSLSPGAHPIAPSRRQQARESRASSQFVTRVKIGQYVCAGVGGHFQQVYNCPLQSAWTTEQDARHLRGQTDLICISDPV
ncbi:hypothetical protein chiPu_0006571 [Chiloscyllium punctatum]|uniref:Uncharacterized protein n=1 Tax=Chiloscyllium punctatum TaxID=137246 RepID=A0A401SCS0_CHIPU|nr:hypothetical protein [Chiloscyllium punctatum]